MYYYAERPLTRARAYEVAIKRLHEVADHVNDDRERYFVLEAIAALTSAMEIAERSNKKI